MLIGYARVSTHDQHMRLQLDALEKAGCSKIFHDHGMSGTRRNRPGLTEALTSLNPGDTLVVWRLDRLGRTIRHLIETVEDMARRNIQLRSVHEAIDTDSSGGKLFFHMMAALAEFERDLISERTHAGLAAARSRGIMLGRPSSLSRLSTEELQHVQSAFAADEALPAVAERFGVCARTVRRWREAMTQGEQHA